MATNRPLLKAAMQILRQQYPGTVQYDALRRQARDLIGGIPTDPKVTADDTQTLAVGLLNCYMGSDLVELHGAPIVYTRTPGDKPTALPLARLQATRGPIMANRRHEVVRLNELDRHLIPLLDGTNDRAALVEKLTALTKENKMQVQRDGAPIYEEADIRLALQSVIDQALLNVARLGVMTV